jgi:hypothetical protein
MEAHGLPRGQVLRLAAYGDAQPLNAGDPLADENRRLSILARRMTPATDADLPAAQRAPDSAEHPATERG